MERPPSTAQWLDQVLRTRIVQGVFPMGARINEANLAQELGISRGPVREALRRLETEGLVEYLPNRGCLVRSYTADSLREIATLRSVLEQYAVQLAFTLDAKALFAALDQRLAEMRAAALRLDREGVIRADLAFHQSLVASAGHALLAKHWAMISQPVFYFISIQPRTTRELADLAETHAPILETLRSGQSVHAIEAAVDKHIMDALDLVLCRGIAKPEATPPEDS